MKKLVKIVLLMCLATRVGEGWAQTQTNLEVLIGLYEKSFDDTLGKLTITDTVGVISTATAKTNYGWLIETGLAGSLKKSGVRQVYLQRDNVTALQAIYNPLAQEIVYANAGKNKVRRTINTSINLTILDSHKSLLFSDRLFSTFCDTLRVADIGKVENANMPFSIGWRKKSWFAKMLEPAVVTAASGLIVFLFYSYRSQ